VVLLEKGCFLALEAPMDDGALTVPEMGYDQETTGFEVVARESLRRSQPPSSAP
jgi:hypothetical protein